MTPCLVRRAVPRIERALRRGYRWGSPLAGQLRRSAMRWTRPSFFYLTVGGLGLLAAPELALRLLGATGSYRSSLSLLIGALLLALGMPIARAAPGGTALPLYPGGLHR